jgi:hypothetical protein
MNRGMKIFLAETGTPRGLFPARGRGWGKISPRQSSRGRGRGKFPPAGTGMGSRSPTGNSPLPSLGSVVIFVRSLDLPPVPIRPKSPYGSLVAFAKLLDLPIALSSPSPARKTSQDFTSGMKASLWGARLMALPSISGCLGAFCLETFSRSACLGCLCQTLCS